MTSKLINILQYMADEVTIGFRFYPTEDELVAFYLRNQLEGRSDDSMHRVIPVLDVFEVEPSHLPSTFYPQLLLIIAVKPSSYYLSHKCVAQDRFL